MYACIIPCIYPSIHTYHHGDVGLEAGGLEGLGEEAELLGALLVVNVVNHALAEGGHVELIHLLLRHLIVSALRIFKSFEKQKFQNLGRLEEGGGLGRQIFGRRGVV